MRPDAPALARQGGVHKVLVQLQVPQGLHDVGLVVVPLEAVVLPSSSSPASSSGGRRRHDGGCWSFLFFAVASLRTVLSLHDTLDDRCRLQKRGKSVSGVPFFSPRCFLALDLRKKQTGNESEDENGGGGGGEKRLMKKLLSGAEGRGTKGEGRRREREWAVRFGWGRRWAKNGRTRPDIPAANQERK